MNILNFGLKKTQKYNKNSVIIRDSKLMPSTSVKELNSAKGAFENYAKSQNISITFFDPRFASDRFSPMLNGSEIEACVAVGITNHKKSPRPDFILMDYFKTENKKFVHDVFNKIQELVEGDTRLPIEKEKAKIIKQLIKAGKIKA